MRAGVGDLWRGRGTFFNPVSASETLVSNKPQYWLAGGKKIVWCQTAMYQLWKRSECAAFMANLTGKHEMLHPGGHFLCKDSEQDRFQT